MIFHLGSVADSDAPTSAPNLQLLRPVVKSSSFGILLGLGVIRLSSVTNPSQSMATTNEKQAHLQKVVNLALHYLGSNAKATRR